MQSTADEVFQVYIGSSNFLAAEFGTTAATTKLAGVASTDFARLSQANEFLAIQKITAAVAVQRFRESGAASDEKEWFIGGLNSGRFRMGTESDAVSGGNDFLAVDRTGTTVDSVALTATAITLAGAVTAATIANSDSETLVAGQLHFIDGNATLPNLTAGQWIQVVNDSASPITISKNGSDTTYWAASGASVSTSFTLAARGVLTARCNPAGTAVYVTGSGITAAS
jgi:hypothetical protein